jgi:hypothetical protein
MKNWLYHICTMMIMWQATKNNLWQSPTQFGSALVENQSSTLLTFAKFEEWWSPKFFASD